MIDDNGKTFGDILNEARAKAGRDINVDLPPVTKTVTVKRNIAFPEWMVLALNGQKISAIKALREVAHLGPDGESLALVQSKNIVEDFMLGISTTETVE